MRFSFAFFGINESYRDFSTLAELTVQLQTRIAYAQNTFQPGQLPGCPGQHETSRGGGYETLDAN
jgi:hypothetical protein